jgi:hypothetical protein
MATSEFGYVIKQVPNLEVTVGSKSVLNINKTTPELVGVDFDK